MPQYICLQEAESTNTRMKAMASQLPSGSVIYTPCQTAGRGQKGNTWESEPDKNLAFSFLLKNPNLAANEQFHISEACSLAVLDTLSAFADGFAIKWPNDIYHGDNKICGILIENALFDKRIGYSIIGIGININQERFVSDAPNPISLKNITGRDYDLQELLTNVCQRIENLCDFSQATPTSLAATHSRFMAHLYRADGKMHPWELPDGTRFDATISGIAPDGILTLTKASGASRDFAFKEVKHVIKNITI